MSSQFQPVARSNPTYSLQYRPLGRTYPNRIRFVLGEALGHSGWKYSDGLLVLQEADETLDAAFMSYVKPMQPALLDRATLAHMPADAKIELEITPNQESQMKLENLLEKVQAYNEPGTARAQAAGIVRAAQQSVTEAYIHLLAYRESALATEDRLKQDVQSAEAAKTSLKHLNTQLMGRLRDQKVEIERLKEQLHQQADWHRNHEAQALRTLKQQHRQALHAAETAAADTASNLAQQKLRTTKESLEEQLHTIAEEKEKLAAERERIDKAIEKRVASERAKLAELVEESVAPLGLFDIGQWLAAWLATNEGSEKLEQKLSSFDDQQVRKALSHFKIDKELSAEIRSVTREDRNKQCHPSLELVAQRLRLLRLVRGDFNHLALVDPFMKKKGNAGPHGPNYKTKGIEAITEQDRRMFWEDVNAAAAFKRIGGI